MLRYAPLPGRPRRFSSRFMPPSFRVAHVNVTRGYRGGERQTELLIRELAKHGVGQVLVGRRSQPLPERLAGTDLEIRLTSGNPFAVFGATGGVDIVHVHEGRSVYGAYLRSLLSGTPYILTRRVDNPIRDHGFAHRAYARAAFVATVAPAVAEIVERFDARIRTAVVVSSSSCLPVDAERADAIRRRSEGQFIVGHVGALDNVQKAQEHILTVARSLERASPDIRFVLVGGGPDEAMLKASAAGLGNVAFTGFVDNVGDYLAAFDLFVLPSNYEGIGSILLDAMGQRLPVVASRVGGVPWLIRDGETGVLIDPGRPDQLEAAILRLRASPETMRRLGDAGFELAKQYTPAAMCAKYLDLYRQALGHDDA